MAHVKPIRSTGVLPLAAGLAKAIQERSPVEGIRQFDWSLFDRLPVIAHFIEFTRSTAGTQVIRANRAIPVK